MSELRGTKIIPVIRVAHTRGDGKQDVFRIVTEYYSPAGEFLCEHDPCDARDREITRLIGDNAALDASRNLDKGTIRSLLVINAELAARLRRLEKLASPIPHSPHSKRRKRK